MQPLLGMTILKFPTQNYIECVERLERAIFQMGLSPCEAGIGRKEGYVQLDISDDMAEAVKEIYYTQEHASA